MGPLITTLIIVLLIVKQWTFLVDFEFIEVWIDSAGAWDLLGRDRCIFLFGTQSSMKKPLVIFLILILVFILLKYWNMRHLSIHEEIVRIIAIVVKVENELLLLILWTRLRMPMTQRFKYLILEHTIVLNRKLQLFFANPLIDGQIFLLPLVPFYHFFGR